MRALDTSRALPALGAMLCDGASAVLIGCRAPVRYGVRIHVPSKTQFAPGHAQVRAITMLHACEDHRHAGCFRLDDLLTDRLKAYVEDYARKRRPFDWKADFGAAFLQYVDVFDPAYKRFVAAVCEHAREEAELLWGAPIGHA